MKGLIRLAIAVVILAGLGGLYLWLGKQNKPAEAATPPLATFDSGSVQQISIQDGSNPPVTLSKQGGNWRLLQLCTDLLFEPNPSQWSIYWRA